MNTAAGLIEIGSSGMRRAIEFSFYAMKIALSKNEFKLQERVKIWLNRSDSKAHRDKFAKVFSIPCQYQPKKYKVLRPLILVSDECSEFGVHVNLKSMIFQTKVESTKENIGYKYYLSAEEKIKDKMTLTVLLTG